MSPIKLFMRFSLTMLLGFSFFAVVSVAFLSADAVTNDGVTINEFTIPTAGSAGITAGPDGNLWFTENSGNKIGRITTAGVITEFPIPTARSFPEDITAGPDGNLWFTEWNGNKIGQVIIQKPSAVNMSVSPGSVNFGNVNVGQSANQTITITNQASSTAALTGSVGTLSAPFSVESGGGTFNLTPGQSVTVTVQFSPITAGTASAVLSITHNAANQNNPVLVAVSGTGISANVPIISVTPMSYDYGNVNVKKSRTGSFMVTYSGKANLTISTSIKGTDASMFKITGGGGGKTIKPGKSLTIKVAFKPTSAGSKSAMLEITSNDPVTPTLDIPLRGTGQ